MTLSLKPRLDERRLARWLLSFFGVLALLSALLAFRAFDQLQWEAFRQQRQSAIDSSARIDRRLRALVDAEEQRTFAEYQFLTVLGDGDNTFLQPSVLSALPGNTTLPGLVGYFQVDSGGTLTSPALPASSVQAARYGITDTDYQRRRALREALLTILAGSADRPPVTRERRFAASLDDAGRLSEGMDAPASKAINGDRPARAPSSPAANVFDRLSSRLGSLDQALPADDYAQVEELELDARLEQKSRAAGDAKQAARETAQLTRRRPRKEQVAIVEPTPPLAEVGEPEIAIVGSRAAQSPPAALPDAGAAATASKDRRDQRVRLFESEVDPFAFSVLDADHLLLHRNVWRGGERFIQGAVIRRDPFLAATIGAVYGETGPTGAGSLLIAHSGSVIARFGSGNIDARTYRPGVSDLTGELLYRTRLSPPFGAMELIHSVRELPAGPGARYLAALLALFGLVLGGGCYVIYRYGSAQLALYRQQQDFVAAVSHELKTPLTSIRMYSEMLTAGWADEAKKRTYYRFIQDESERLSRLITNVLQLARLTRGNHDSAPTPHSAGELLDMACSKVATLVEQAGFTLETRVDEPTAATRVTVDGDLFTQIIINLVENAVKFTPQGARRQIDLACERSGTDHVRFTVRDYGAGIAPDQMTKIFDLFYRPAGELTRETTGTGIGLALVRELVAAMGGRVEVDNATPGAVFSVTLPV